jgi:copper chaperone
MTSIAFTVQDMTCGHCAGTITAALKAADPAGACEIDLATKKVRVESALPAERLAKVIRDAGYSPVAA